MMFKRLVNTLLSAIVPMVVASSFWDITGFGSSLFLFGEPDFPKETQSED